MKIKPLWFALLCVLALCGMLYTAAITWIVNEAEKPEGERPAWIALKPSPTPYDYGAPLESIAATTATPYSVSSDWFSQYPQRMTLDFYKCVEYEKPIISGGLTFNGRYVRAVPNFLTIEDGENTRTLTGVNRIEVILWDEKHTSATIRIQR